MLYIGLLEGRDKRGGGERVVQQKGSLPMQRSFAMQRLRVDRSALLDHQLKDAEKVILFCCIAMPHKIVQWRGVVLGKCHHS